MKVYRHNDGHCLLCEEKNPETLYTLGDFNLIRCKRCALVATDLSVDRATLETTYSQSYYENRYEYYFQNSVINPSLDGENSNIKDFRRGLSLIKKYKSHGNLLDVGCGPGVFLSLAREDGWQTQGVDISPYASSYARAVLGLEVFSGELTEAQFADNFFDVITLWDVLEHFPDPDRQLLEVHRVLKGDGILLVNTPNEAGLLRVLARAIFRLSGGTVSYPMRKLYHEFHLYYFTPETFRKLMKKSGFDILRMERRSIAIPKARGRPLEKLIVKVLSWPEKLCRGEYEIWAIAKKLG